jgi:hypothetical protein
VNTEQSTAKLGGGDPVARQKALEEFHGRIPGDLATRIHRDFQYHPVTSAEAEVMAIARDELENVSGLLAGLAGQPSRELSIALTHMEDAMMWFNAGIARSGR